MAKNTKLSSAFYLRNLLTVEEAAVYFHIGYKKMRCMVKDYERTKIFKIVDVDYAVRRRI